jgi:hypothetical protein
MARFFIIPTPILIEGFFVSREKSHVVTKMEE